MKDVIKPDNKEFSYHDYYLAYEHNKHLRTIFLGGSIDNGSARDWYSDVIDNLDDSLDWIVFNPRNDNWNSNTPHTSDCDELVEQIEWEHYWLDKVDIKFFNFEPKSKSPITLMELGYELGRIRVGHMSDVVVVCPTEFYRSGNVDVMCGYLDVPVYRTIKEAVDAINKRYKSQGK